MDIKDIKLNVIDSIREKFSSVLTSNGVFKPYVEVWWVRKTYYVEKCDDLMKAKNSLTSNQDLILFVPLSTLVLDVKNRIKYDNKYIVINYTQYMKDSSISNFDVTTQIRQWKYVSRLKDRPIETLARMCEELGLYEDAYGNLIDNTNQLTNSTYFKYNNRIHKVKSIYPCAGKRLKINYISLKNPERIATSKAYQSYEHVSSWEENYSPLTIHNDKIGTDVKIVSVDEVKKEYNDLVKKSIPFIEKEIKKTENDIKYFQKIIEKSKKYITKAKNLISES